MWWCMFFLKVKNMCMKYLQYLQLTGCTWFRIIFIFKLVSTTLHFPISKNADPNVNFPRCMCMNECILNDHLPLFENMYCKDDKVLVPQPL